MAAREEIDRRTARDHPQRVAQRSDRESREVEQNLRSRVILRGRGNIEIGRGRGQLHHGLEQADQRLGATGDTRLGSRRRQQGGEPDQRGETGNNSASEAHASNRILAQGRARPP